MPENGGEGFGAPSSDSVQWTNLRSVWKQIAIDLVGKLQVPSGQGHRFIWTMVDLCTCWVEAIPQKYLTVEVIADALLSTFCCMGFPDVILSDNGTQFVSRTTSIKHFLMVNK